MKFLELTKGTVVKSLAGHDKGSIQTIIGVYEKGVLVCDGKTRKLKKPKRKNIKHLECTKSILDEKQMASDSAIRKALREYR